jgi:aspartate aminotransferase
MTNRPPLADRLRTLQPSASVSVSKRAAELKAAGIEVISFGRGQPDFETPEHIRRAAQRAIDQGLASHYTAVGGVPELKEAIRESSRRHRGGFEHRPEEVVVSSGAKHSLFNLAMVLCGEGDECIIPAPYWVSYPAQVRLAGGIPRFVPTTERDGFLLTPEALEAAVTGRTRMLILCSPSNPTGAVYSPERLAEIAEVARRHSFWIVVDEIYSRLIYSGARHVSFAEVAPDLRDRLIIVDGVGKTYAMTGWRIGWILAPSEVAKACEILQGQTASNPAAVSQYATLAALTGPQEPVEEMLRAYEERRRVVVDGLNAIDGFSCPLPEGAFYAFPNVSGIAFQLGGDRGPADDAAVADWLMREARCAVVTGSSYGMPGYIRISYATSLELIRRGLDQIAEAAARIPPRGD